MAMAGWAQPFIRHGLGLVRVALAVAFPRRCGLTAAPFEDMSSRRLG